MVVLLVLFLLVFLLVELPANTMHTIWNRDVGDSIISIIQLRQGIFLSTTGGITFLENDGVVRWKKDLDRNVDRIDTAGTSLFCMLGDTLQIYNFDGTLKGTINSSFSNEYLTPNLVYVNAYVNEQYQLSIFNHHGQLLQNVVHPYEQIVPYLDHDFIATKKNTIQESAGDSVQVRDYVHIVRLDSTFAVTWEYIDSSYQKVKEIFDCIVIKAEFVISENRTIYVNVRSMRQMPFFVSGKVIIFTEQGELMGSFDPAPGGMLDKYKFSVLPDDRIIYVYNKDSYYTQLQKRKGPYSVKRNVAINVFNPLGVSAFATEVKTHEYNYYKEISYHAGMYLVHFISTTTPALFLGEQDSIKIRLLDESGFHCTEIDSCRCAIFSDSSSILLGKSTTLKKITIPETSVNRNATRNIHSQFSRIISYREMLAHFADTRVSVVVFNLQGHRIAHSRLHFLKPGLYKVHLKKPGNSHMCTLMIL